MNLLEQEVVKDEKKSNSKKIVLMLLIFCIVLLIILVGLLVVITGNKELPLTLSINGKKASLENKIIMNQNGVNYISLKQLSEFIELDYTKGGYLEEDNNNATNNSNNNSKCYLSTSDQIIGFEANSNEIYKKYLNTEKDNEYYELENKVLYTNDQLYVALEDLNVACNVNYTFSEKDNKMQIKTAENIFQECEKIFEEKELELSDDINNKKALVYGLIVLKNDTGKFGVLDSDLKSVISYKYETMQFNEISQNFIVSNDKKYGIVAKDGRAITEPRYDSIRIINNSPLLYEVKLNSVYGILNENGKNITKIEYDKIGFSSDSNMIDSVLVIKEIENKQDGVVVLKKDKYGIVNLSTGNMIVKCEVDKIYSKSSELGENKYYIELEDKEVELQEYIRKTNVTIITN